MALNHQPRLWGTVDSKKLEHRCGVIYTRFPSFSVVLGSEHGHIPKFLLLQYAGLLFRNLI